jgi:hypothetical protein
MSTEVLERRFAAMGARVRLVGTPLGAPSVDVLGSTFELRFPGAGPEAGVEVIDVRPADRHLLLLVRHGDEKSKFLCGHDERHWFVAAVPESARGVTGVATAKLALQPPAVQQAAWNVRAKDRFRRRTSAFVRQGEWFFVPAPWLDPPALSVLRDEPLSRGGGNTHVLAHAYRRGGDTVYVNPLNPNGISEARFRRLPPARQRSGGWVPMTLDPELFAKGSVRHPDHATIVLPGWHRVLMNTEREARAMRHVAFLD